MLSLSTCGGGTSNSAFTRRRARSAVSGSAASTATSPSRFTTVTPGMASAAEVSTRTSVAPCAGGRTIRA